MSGIFDQVINYAPPSLLLGTVTYKGTWSAATNTPTLPNPPSAITNGNYYVVSAAGTQFSLSFNIGDWIISNGSAWEKVDNTDAVSSVFGRTGAVVGVSTDYSAVGITATAVGASSPSTGAFTTLSATTPLAVASGGTGVASSTGTTNVVLSGSPTITTPVIAQINDANGNETLKLASIASAVNEVTIENAATGNAVHISATGGDASVGLHLAGKGASGYVNVQDSTDATKRIMFNASGGTTNTRTMLSSTQTVDRTLSLPDATDTLVGKATTDTLTNKTLTSPTITGGALNGTLGATTPSSVAATTGTFSSTLGVTGVATLGNGAILGTPASGTVTNLTGTASININGTVGATTPSTVVGTTIGGTRLSASGDYVSNGGDITLTNTNGGRSWRIGDGIAGVTSALVIFDATGSAIIGKFTTTGLNSTAIGATTPSTGAFTTGIINLSSGSDQQETLSVRGNSGVGMLLRPSFSAGTQTNWRVAASIVASATLEITPSTAVGGTTFTTPVATFTSAGAAITGTLSATGQITSTTTGQFFLNNTPTTQANYMRLTNTSGNMYFGLEGATPILGGTAYDTVLVGKTGLSLSGNDGGGTQLRVTATGAAITGTLSATGLFSLTGGSGGQIATFNSTNVNGIYHTYSTNGTAIGDIGSGYQTVSGSSADFGITSRSGKLVFGTGSSVRAVIDSSGNVGIGTTSPGTTLDVQAANASFRVYGTGATDTPQIQLRNGNQIWQQIVDGADSNKWKLKTGGGTTVLNCDTSGGLAVTGGSTATGGFSTTFNASVGTPGYISQDSTDTSGAVFIRFNKSNGTSIGSITRVTTTDAVVLNTTSDARLKENLRDFTDSGRLIDALKPRVFDWKDSDSNGKDVIGFVAQEEHTADPVFAHIGAVSVGDDDPTTIAKQWQRSDAALIPILVAELQSLRKRLAALESK